MPYGKDGEKASALREAIPACRQSFLAGSVFSLFGNALKFVEALYVLQICDPVKTSHKASTLMTSSTLLLSLPLVMRTNAQHIPRSIGKRSYETAQRFRQGTDHQSLAKEGPGPSELAPSLRPQTPEQSSSEPTYFRSPGMSGSYRFSAGERSAGSADEVKGEGQTPNGRFVPEDRVGVGGMSTVHRAPGLPTAEACDRDRDVAVNVLIPQCRERPELFVALQRKARKVQSLLIPTTSPFRASTGMGPPST
jgi:hypothetical protein